MKTFQTKIHKYQLFSYKIISGSAKKPDEKKTSNEDEQNLADLRSALRRSQGKCQLVQTSFIKRIEFLLYAI